ncbi:hypothetical protein N7501_003616 [Penicillium viridicatum]|nr:hypothetical protein N7501_003616 [Penicillium viridicatum]
MDSGRAVEFAKLGLDMSAALDRDESKQKGLSLDQTGIRKTAQKDEWFFRKWPNRVFHTKR